MVTGELKNQIDNIWETFWTGGLTNPLDVIEQMTYLFFMHDLDDIDNRKSSDAILLDTTYNGIFSGKKIINDREFEGRLLKWSVFKDQPADRMFEIVSQGVFPFICTMKADKDSAFARHMEKAVFKIPNPKILESVVGQITQLYERMESLGESDIRGDVYEYLLSQLSQSGINGQFRTPRHIIRMMVELIEPRPEDRICDPACGTAGFLVGAENYLIKKYRDEITLNPKVKKRFTEETFYGFDMDPTMLRIGAMNLMLHGVSDPHIEYQDSLSDSNREENRYSLILANPPFKGSLNEDIVNPALTKMCKSKKTELLFIAQMLRMLTVGGRCACIVPSGVLFGSTKAHKEIRRVLVEENTLHAVISMPSGVFKPYAGVSTAILIFTKTGNGGTDKVWFYDMEADGYSLDDKRMPVKENDIPDVVKRYRTLEEENTRARTEKSFLVSKSELAENGYDLSFNKYRETVQEKIEYPPTKDLLNQIRDLMEELNKNIDELEKML